MTTLHATHRRLAVASNWALCGSFGLCLILSGFALALPQAILGGFALLVAAFIAHLVINRLFRQSFTTGEVVTGFVAFGVGVASFLATALAGSGVGRTQFDAGLAGFASLVLCFLAYLVTKFGLKGAFSQFHGSSGAREDTLAS